VRVAEQHAAAFARGRGAETVHIAAHAQFAAHLQARRARAARLEGGGLLRAGLGLRRLRIGDGLR